MNEYSHKYESIKSRIYISDAVTAHPDEQGLYIYKCAESEGEWEFAAICFCNGILVVKEDVLGSTPLDTFCSNLIDLYWQKVS